MKKQLKFRTYPMLIALIVVSGMTFISAVSSNYQQKEWVVPAGAKNMKNPTDPDNKESLFQGKSLYAKNCRSCHGKSGLGDGPDSKKLSTFAGDFTTSEFTSQTDGELFYKIMEGRDEMPSFKKVIPKEQNVWYLVNYIRTMAE